MNSADENPLLISIILNSSPTYTSENPFGTYLELKASGVDQSSEEVREVGGGPVGTVRNVVFLS